jgi:hypothetical protein
MSEIRETEEVGFPRRQIVELARESRPAVEAVWLDVLVDTGLTSRAVSKGFTMLTGADAVARFATRESCARTVSVSARHG